MIRALVVDTWLRFLRSPWRLGIFAALVVLEVTWIAALRISGIGLGGMVYFVAGCAAAGLVGQDASSGLLRVFLASPLPRWRLVVGRWLGGASLASVLGVVVVAAQALTLHLAGDTAPADVLVEGMVLVIVDVTVIAASLVAASTLVPGLADVGMLVAAIIGRGMLSDLPDDNPVTPVFVDAIAAWPRPFAGLATPLGVAIVASNVALVLVVAVVVLNGRELRAGSR